MDDWKKLKGAGILSEFGCVNEHNKSLEDITYMCDLVDEHMQSFAYWNYKPYHDLTTHNFVSEGMYYNDGLLFEKKARAMSRTYP